jgi:hypothetical protein
MPVSLTCLKNKNQIAYLIFENERDGSMFAITKKRRKNKEYNIPLKKMIIIINFATVQGTPKCPTSEAKVLRFSFYFIFS